MSWQSAVRRPLGLAGYALACVFGLVAWFAPSERYPWLAPAAVAMAGVSLIVALAIALRHRSASVSRRKNEGPTVSQRTEGDQSPTIADVHGNVSVGYETKCQKPIGKG